MSEVNRVNFTLNSVYDGNSTFHIFDNINCTGTTVYSGSTNIIDGSSEVEINETLDIQNDVSIKFIDSKGCETCNNFFVEPPPVEFTNETNIILFFDSSGSMASTETPLNEMKDTILKDCLLPFYNDDENLYNEKVSIINDGTERTMNMLNYQGNVLPTGNSIVLIFQDEAQPVYHDNTFDVNTSTTQYDTDISNFRDNLINNSDFNDYRAILFQVQTDVTSLYESFKELLQAVQNGNGAYSGSNGLSDRNEVGFVYNVNGGDTAEYYMDLIITEINKLGYDIPNCTQQ